MIGTHTRLPGSGPKRLRRRVLEDTNSGSSLVAELNSQTRRTWWRSVARFKFTGRRSHGDHRQHTEVRTAVDANGASMWLGVAPDGQLSSNFKLFTQRTDRPKQTDRRSCSCSIRIQIRIGLEFEFCLFEKLFELFSKKRSRRPPTLAKVSLECGVALAIRTVLIAQRWLCSC